MCILLCIAAPGPRCIVQRNLTEPLLSLCPCGRAIQRDVQTIQPHSHPGKANRTLYNYSTFPCISPVKQERSFTVSQLSRPELSSRLYLPLSLCHHSSNNFQPFPTPPSIIPHSTLPSSPLVDVTDHEQLIQPIRSAPPIVHAHHLPFECHRILSC